MGSGIFCRCELSRTLTLRGFLEQGLAAPNDHNAVSFRSVNFPDRYIRHRDFHLFVEPRGSPNLAPDATFIKTTRID